MKRNVDDILIPPDIQVMLEEKPPTTNQLDAIGKALESRKKEAITYRQTCGIEDVWAACEDAYNGIDDANRAEFGGIGSAGAPGGPSSSGRHHTSPRSRCPCARCCSG